VHNGVERGAFPCIASGRGSVIHSPNGFLGQERALLLKSLVLETIGTVQFEGNGQ